MAHAKLGIGIDITDGSIEASLVRVIGPRTLTLEGCAHRELSDAAILHGVIHDAAEVATVLKAVRAELGVTEDHLATSCALPDTQVVVTRVAFSPLRQEPSYDAYDHLVREFIATQYPHLNDPVVRWCLSSWGGENSVMVFLTRKKYIRDWAHFLHINKLSFVACEMQSGALLRALVRRIPRHEVVGMLDIGLRYSSVSFFSTFGLLYSHATDHGSYHLALVAGSPAHAMGAKIAYARGTPNVGRTPHSVPSFLEGSIDRIAATLELDTAVQTYNPSRFLLVGALSFARDVSRTIAHRIRMPLEAAPISWLVAEQLSKVRPSATEYERYSASIGLALRSCGVHSTGGEINFVSTV